MNDLDDHEYDCPLRCGKCGRPPGPGMRVGRVPDLGVVVCDLCAAGMRSQGKQRLSNSEVAAWLRPEKEQSK
jgi:hypothetical protein